MSADDQQERREYTDKELANLMNIYRLSLGYISVINNSDTFVNSNRARRDTKYRKILERNARYLLEMTIPEMKKYFPEQVLRDVGIDLTNLETKCKKILESSETER